MAMIINDNVYGKEEVNDPVILELLKTPSILRLKKISQYGVPDKYYYLNSFSRYEHSVGVMILLKKLGATLEEQIAGLLHDVSVLAFSHIADWVFGGGRNGVEDYHDSIHKEFVKNTEIPEILNRYGFSLNRVLNEENFLLLERHLPFLCADRVDYSLREFNHWFNPEMVSSYADNLVNRNDEIVFKDVKSAFDFSTNFLELQTQHWGGYESVTRYVLFSDALKLAINTGELEELDFYKDEEYILNKFEKTGNEEIIRTLELLKNKELPAFASKTGEKVIVKFRYVDPRVLVNGDLVKLSEMNSEFKEILEKHRKINQKGLIV